MLARFLSFTGGMATFAQVLVALPMALDLLGPPSFLLLSLLLAFHHFTYSTLRLILKNTPLAPLISVLSFLSPIITPTIISITLWYYFNPPQQYSAASASLLPFSPSYILVQVLPYVYASILRWVSPLFTLLEGISTLLVCQVVGRAGKGWADDDGKEEGIEWRSLLGLVAASLIYCAGLAGIVKTFPTFSTFPAFLLGAALATVLFLSLIGFHLRRTNVLETSMVFVYIVYSAWLSGVEARMEPRQYGTGWLPSSTLSTPKQIAESTPTALLHRVVQSTNPTQGILSSLYSVTSTLPPHMLLSLIYRITVLHFAARIVPMIRKSSAGWDDGMGEEVLSSGDVSPGFWDGRSLGQEPANMRVTTIVLSYRRAILIAVYTHLLLLDAGSQTWWRWINIALFLSVWSMELLLDGEGEETDALKWKTD